MLKKLKIVLEAKQELEYCHEVLSVYLTLFTIKEELFTYFLKSQKFLSEYETVMIRLP
jgi:hypothetical protein